MEKFIAATPRPWILQGYTDAYTNIIRPESEPGRITCSSTYRTDAELIVTAVNNFDKMKDAIETQLQIIEALISSKRIANLDESIAYYKQLLESLK